MMNYKLLTPGPLTTTETVKKEMMFDPVSYTHLQPVPSGTGRKYYSFLSPAGLG